MNQQKDQSQEIPREAKVVILGAGIVGCSTAYHLAQRGWKDILVLDRGPLFQTGGSTSHAPGLVFQLNASKTLCQLAQWSAKLYGRVQQNGLPCYYPVGSLEVATTRERWLELARKKGHALSWGLPAELLTPREAQLKIPLLNSQLLHGALFVPSDGIAKAVRAAEALANEAMEKSQGRIRFLGNTAVTGFDIQNGAVCGVFTAQGRIQTEKVLVCAGIWGPLIGKMAGVSIPLTPVEHQYVRTSPLAELAGAQEEVVHPILRHQDRSLYFRQEKDAYGIGSYHHEPLVVEPEILAQAEGEMPSVRPFTEKHFGRALSAATDLLPALAGKEFPYKINGMFSFTTDGMPLLGESRDVKNFWVAEAVWVTHAGGVGQVMAEWMTEGAPSLDLREMELNRFHPHAYGRQYIRERGAQNYREVYDIIHPSQQMEQLRPLRRSPFYEKQKELGAVFFESVGWERPQWFDRNENLPGPTLPWAKRNEWTSKFWSPMVGLEHLRVREKAGLFDLTPFTKIKVTGKGALSYLQRLTGNQMDRPVGKAVYTSLLNEKGGIVCDLTVTRLASQEFLVLTGAGVGQHDYQWFLSHLPPEGEGGDVQVTEVTSSYCCLGLWGPTSRQILQKVAEEDLSAKAFPYFTAKKVFLGNVPTLMIRLSYVGELGWEIYAPTEYGGNLWETLWEAGQAPGMGLIAAGGGAFDSLRLEKGYRLWGADIHTEYHPFEAGLGFTVNFQKGDFLGREALLKIRDQGLSRKLCCLTLDDPQALVLGKEPVLSAGTDKVLGYVTSANYGYSVGRGICYGYLPVAESDPGNKVEIYFFGERFKATVSKEPLFDPDQTRLKS